MRILNGDGQIMNNIAVPQENILQNLSTCEC